MKALARKLARRLAETKSRLAKRLAASIQSSCDDLRLPLFVQLVFFGYILKRTAQRTLASPMGWSRREFQHFRREIAAEFVFKLHRWSTHSGKDDLYAACARNNRCTDAELDRMRRASRHFEFRPLISILVPVHDARPEWLERLVGSVLAQTYDRWELILVDDGSTSTETRKSIERFARRDERITSDRLAQNSGVVVATNRAAELASGEFLAFVDHDDELYPDSLWMIAHRLQSDPDADLLYTDEEIVPDPITGEAPYPYFKPGFSPELLAAYNYICHLLVVRRTPFDAVGGLRAGTDGAQDHDLVLRVIEHTNRVIHIPRVLYRWHIVPHSMSRTSDAKSGKLERKHTLDCATQRVVQDHFDRTGICADAEMVEGWVRPRFRNQNHGLASIIICTKDHARLVWQAVRSIERSTSYPNYEIIIVDNGSRGLAARAALRLLGRRHRVIRLESGPEGFNFARLNNEAARHARGRYLLFLNDDIRVLTEEWLTALAGYLTTPGVGVVGARLRFPDGSNQHAGLILGAMGWGPWHLLRGVHENRCTDYRGLLSFPRNCVGVTGACLMTTAEIFAQVGGFDEARFAVGFNDVDYCLRVRALGFRVVYAPQADLIHFEGQSRSPIADPREMSALKRRWNAVPDPYWNPHYERHSANLLVSTRRRSRELFSDRIPRILLVARNSQSSARKPSLTPVLEQLAARGACSCEDAASVDPTRPDWQADLHDAIARTQPDVIVVDGREGAEAVHLIAAMDIPSIWNLPEHLLASCDASPLGWKEELQLAQALDKPLYVVFGSTYSHGLAAGGVHRSNFQVIDAFDHETPAETNELGSARNRLRSYWNASDDSVVFLAVVELSNDSPEELILWAFQSAMRRSPSALLWIVVEGECSFRSAERLRQWVARLGQRAIVIADCEALDDYMAAADVFITQPVTDVRSLHVMRALHHGLAVIGSRNLVETELLYPGANGLSFQRWSKRSLSAAIRRYADDPALARRHGVNSRHWLYTRTDRELILADWSNLLREAAELSPNWSRTSSKFEGAHFAGAQPQHASTQ